MRRIKTEEATIAVDTQAESVATLTAELQGLTAGLAVTGIMQNKFGEDITGSVQTVLSNLKDEFALFDAASKGIAKGGLLTGSAAKTKKEKQGKDPVKEAFDKEQKALKAQT